METNNLVKLTKLQMRGHVTQIQTLCSEQPEVVTVGTRVERMTRWGIGWILLDWTLNSSARMNGHARVISG